MFEQAAVTRGLGHVPQAFRFRQSHPLHQLLACKKTIIIRMIKTFIINNYVQYIQQLLTISDQNGLEFCTVQSQKKDNDRREGKDRRCWLGGVLECRTSIQQQGLFEKKILGEHPFWYGGVLVNRMIIHFCKASIPPSSRYSVHLFLQVLLVENSYSAAKN